jgi:hypothetical protein
VLLGVSLVPRFSATFFRWLGLAYWSNDTSFSLACLAQLLWQLGQIVSSRRNATRTKTKTVAAGKKTWNVKKLIMHSNKLSAALSLLSLAVTSTGFFSSNTGRAAGVSLLATVALAYADCRRDFAYDSIIQEARKELDQLKTLSQAPAPESASRTTVPAHKAYHGELQHWYFDVFRKNDLQLQTLVMDVFDDMNLLSKYKISTDKLRRFTEEVAGSYCIDAPYHNKYARAKRAQGGARPPQKTICGRSGLQGGLEGARAKQAQRRPGSWVERRRLRVRARRERVAEGA